jgi:hypothetical protein
MIRPVLVLVIVAGAPGCAFLTGAYPCEEDRHCPETTVCSDGACVDDDQGGPGEGEGEGEAPLCTGEQVVDGDRVVADDGGAAFLDGGCATLTGDLEVTGANVVNVDEVRFVVVIGDDLILSGTRLADSGDFRGVETIGDEVRVEGNSQLTSLRLERLGRAGRLTIRDNALLRTIELPALTSLTGRRTDPAITIENNPVLETLVSPLLREVVGDIVVGNNPRLCTRTVTALVDGLVGFGNAVDQRGGASCP